jgi:hypothetical protein
MRFQRDPFFFMMYVWRFFAALDQLLCQFWVVRFICGGTWFKSDDVWKQCDRVTQQTDGSYILRYEDVSFHETNLSIQSLEHHE